MKALRGAFYLLFGMVMLFAIIVISVLPWYLPAIVILFLDHIGFRNLPVYIIIGNTLLIVAVLMSVIEWWRRSRGRR